MIRFEAAWVVGDHEPIFVPCNNFSDWERDARGLGKYKLKLSKSIPNQDVSSSSAQD